MARALINHTFKNGVYLWIGIPDDWILGYIGKTIGGNTFRIVTPFSMLDIPLKVRTR